MIDTNVKCPAIKLRPDQKNAVFRIYSDYAKNFSSESLAKAMRLKGDAYIYFQYLCDRYGENGG